MESELYALLSVTN